MPKVTLSFNLPKEREELETAMNANILLANINEFSDWLESQERTCEIIPVHAVRKALSEALGD